MITFQLTAFALSCALFCLGAHRVVAMPADAKCQIAHQFTADNDPPTWAATDDVCVETRCPNTQYEYCAVQLISADPYVRKYECDCTDNSQSQGCHGTTVWVKVGGAWLFSNLECAGSCTSPAVCGYQTFTAPAVPVRPSQMGNFKKCGC
jgi:hypothetical protein